MRLRYGIERLTIMHDMHLSSNYPLRRLSLAALPIGDLMRLWHKRDSRSHHRLKSGVRKAGLLFTDRHSLIILTVYLSRPPFHTHSATS